VLIIVPPSETKARTPATGAPVDLDRLSFPALTATRRRVIDGLIATSGRSDAFRRLYVGPSFAADVARNTAILELATRPAAEVYTGPLHAGLDLAGLSPAAAATAASRSVVINSALWGLLRPGDWIPTYRLHIFAELIATDGSPLDRLDHTWRALLPSVLAEEMAREAGGETANPGAAGRGAAGGGAAGGGAADGGAAARGGLALDLRSQYYAASGRPAGLDGRTITLRVEQQLAGRRMGDVVAKRVRGEAAHQLLESMAAADVDPHDPGEVAGMLGERWPVELEPPGARGPTWTLTVFGDD
jgi:uncharacterized protein